MSSFLFSNILYRYWYSSIFRNVFIYAMAQCGQMGDFLLAPSVGTGVATSYLFKKGLVHLLNEI